MPATRSCRCGRAGGLLGAVGGGAGAAGRGGRGKRRGRARCHGARGHVSHGGSCAGLKAKQHALGTSWEAGQVAQGGERSGRDDEPQGARGAWEGFACSKLGCAGWSAGPARGGVGRCGGIMHEGGAEPLAGRAASRGAVWAPSPGTSQRLLAYTGTYQITPGFPGLCSCPCTKLSCWKSVVTGLDRRWFVSMYGDFDTTRVRPRTGQRQEL